MSELTAATSVQAVPRHGVSLGEAFRVWLRVALLSFGAWQAWWLSALWLGAALLARLGETQDTAGS